MTRRGDGRRSGRTGRPPFYVDPAVRLAALNAWRADDCVDNGSVTTSWESYVGASLSLPALGTGQAIKAADSALGGRLSVTFNGNAAANGYAAALLGGAPMGFTIAVVGTAAATSIGVSALTVGGTINTGASIYMSGTAIRGRKVTTDALRTLDPLPKAFVGVAAFNSAGISWYMNRFTPATASLASALAGTRFHLGCLSDAFGSFIHNGAIAKCTVWDRTLSAAEAALVLRMESRYYRLPIIA